MGGGDREGREVEGPSKLGGLEVWGQGAESLG